MGRQERRYKPIQKREMTVLGKIPTSQKVTNLQSESGIPASGHNRCFYAAEDTKSASGNANSLLEKLQHGSSSDGETADISTRPSSADSCTNSLKMANIDRKIADQDEVKADKKTCEKLLVPEFDKVSESSGQQSLSSDCHASGVGSATSKAEVPESVYLGADRHRENFRQEGHTSEAFYSNYPTDGRQGHASHGPGYFPSAPQNDGCYYPHPYANMKNKETVIVAMMGPSGAIFYPPHTGFYGSYPVLLDHMRALSNSSKGVTPHYLSRPKTNTVCCNGGRYSESTRYIDSENNIGEIQFGTWRGFNDPGKPSRIAGPTSDMQKSSVPKSSRKNCEGMRSRDYYKRAPKVELSSENHGPNKPFILLTRAPWRDGQSKNVGNVVLGGVAGSEDGKVLGVSNSVHSGGMAGDENPYSAFRNKSTLVIEEIVEGNIAGKDDTCSFFHEERTQNQGTTNVVHGHKALLENTDKDLLGNKDDAERTHSKSESVLQDTAMKLENIEERGIDEKNMATPCIGLLGDKHDTERTYPMSKSVLHDTAMKLESIEEMGSDEKDIATQCFEEAIMSESIAVLEIGVSTGLVVEQEIIDDTGVNSGSTSSVVCGESMFNEVIMSIDLSKQGNMNVVREVLLAIESNAERSQPSSESEFQESALVLENIKCDSGRTYSSENVLQDTAMKLDRIEESRNDEKSTATPDFKESIMLESIAVLDLGVSTGLVVEEDTCVNDETTSSVASGEAIVNKGSTSVDPSKEGDVKSVSEVLLSIESNAERSQPRSESEFRESALVLESIKYDAERTQTVSENKSQDGVETFGGKKVHVEDERSHLSNESEFQESALLLESIECDAERTQTLCENKCHDVMETIVGKKVQEEDKISEPYNKSATDLVIAFCTGVVVEQESLVEMESDFNLKEARNENGEATFSVASGESIVNKESTSVDSTKEGNVKFVSEIVIATESNAERSQPSSESEFRESALVLESIECNSEGTQTVNENKAQDSFETIGGKKVHIEDERSHLGNEHEFQESALLQESSECDAERTQILCENKSQDITETSWGRKVQEEDEVAEPHEQSVVMELATELDVGSSTGMVVEQESLVELESNLNLNETLHQMVLNVDLSLASSNDSAHHSLSLNGISFNDWPSRDCNILKLLKKGKMKRDWRPKSSPLSYGHTSISQGWKEEAESKKVDAKERGNQSSGSLLVSVVRNECNEHSGLQMPAQQSTVLWENTDSKVSVENYSSDASEKHPVHGSNAESFKVNNAECNEFHPTAPHAQCLTAGFKLRYKAKAPTFWKPKHDSNSTVPLDTSFSSVIEENSEKQKHAYGSGILLHSTFPGLQKPSAPVDIQEPSAVHLTSFDVDQLIAFGYNDEEADNNVSLEIQESSTEPGCPNRDILVPMKVVKDQEAASPAQPERVGVICRQGFQQREYLGGSNRGSGAKGCIKLGIQQFWKPKHPDANSEHPACESGFSSQDNRPPATRSVESCPLDSTKLQAESSTGIQSVESSVIIQMDHVSESEKRVLGSLHQPRKMWQKKGVEGSCRLGDVSDGEVSTTGLIFR